MKTAGEGWVHRSHRQKKKVNIFTKKINREKTKKVKIM